MTNITLFSLIISKLDRLKFQKLVKKQQTDKHKKGYNSWNCKLVEIGNHEDLTEQKGKYYELVKNQLELGE
jgi:Domain of unknown function (DUF4372)